MALSDLDDLLGDLVHVRPVTDVRKPPGSSSRGSHALQIDADRLEPGEFAPDPIVRLAIGAIEVMGKQRRSGISSTSASAF